MSSIIRTGLTSPRSIGSRSILKRPASIAVSSPSSPLQAGSPHVRFAPTPTLTATFTTFTSNAYDRSSITVQPNPLALPEPGDRVFSPTMGGFKPAATRSFRQFDFSGLGFSAMNITSPLVSDFEDPRSPKVTKASGVKFAPAPQLPVRRNTRKATKTDQLSSLPRSPFPSDVGSIEQETQGFEFELSASESDSDIESFSTRGAFGVPKRNKKGLTLGGAKIGSSKMSISSPCTHLGKLGGASALGSSLKRSKKPAPLSLVHSPQSSSAGSSALTQQFWDAVSIHEPESADQPMFTAFERPASDYPEDAVSYEDHNEKHLKTATAPAPPPPLYAGADGVPTSAAVVWSPTFPRPGAAASRIRDSLMSPAVFKRAVTIQRREITAPSPNDPFAAFPSFAAAFEGLQVPPRAAIA